MGETGVWARGLRSRVFYYDTDKHRWNCPKSESVPATTELLEGKVSFSAYALSSFLVELPDALLHVASVLTVTYVCGGDLNTGGHFVAFAYTALVLGVVAWQAPTSAPERDSGFSVRFLTEWVRQCQGE